MDPRVKKVMEPFWSDKFGNPNAIYKEGLAARNAVENARKEVAKILGARPKEIIFTSGGTESDNLAIFGVIGATRGNLDIECPSGRQHIITTQFEHHAVLNTCKFLEKQGFDITYLAVGREGIVNPKDVASALRPETVLVSVMYANNEIGVIQPIKEIAKVIRNFKKNLQPTTRNLQPALFHTDACQAPGYLELNVEKLGVDLMTLNGSKIYGPKGVGILFVKDGVKLEPMSYGGEQERRIRPGTENVPAIAGFAEALKIADAEKEKETKRLSILRDYFIKKLTSEIPKVVLNGHPVERLPNNINVSILDVEGESVVLYLDEAGVACSTGSACASESLEPSHVIMATCKMHAYAHGAMRFSMGRSTTKKDIDFVMKVLPEIVEKLRSISAVKIKI